MHIVKTSVAALAIMIVSHSMAFANRVDQCDPFNPNGSNFCGTSHNDAAHRAVNPGGGGGGNGGGGNGGGGGGNGSGGTGNGSGGNGSGNGSGGTGNGSGGTNGSGGA